MSSTALILGGTGYIGRSWAQRLAARKRFDRIVLADVRPSADPLPPGAEFVPFDLRQPFAPQLPSLRPDWIFSFAAVHREPGHAREEYFDTNLPGARHTCTYAETVGCPNILFTSSIAVYGPTRKPTSEADPFYPTSPYGISKLCAELIHERWLAADPARRLLVCRPAVVYGPGDPGNILRMIRAVRKGYFIYPGQRTIRKSYAYIEGLLDSFEFAMAGGKRHWAYNYAERETETLEGLVRLVQAHYGRRVPTFTAPLSLLVAAAEVMQWATRGRSPIHPVRVRKAMMTTHILPAELIAAGFNFRYDFAASLKDWAARAPADFTA